MKIGLDCLGHHYILELYGCPHDLLSNVDYVSKTMHDVASAGNCNVLSNEYHQFDPYGVSGVTLISESHLSIHSWPQFGYAAVDFFFCSDEVLVDAMIARLKEGFKSTDIKVEVCHRGMRLFDDNPDMGEDSLGA